MLCSSVRHHKYLESFQAKKDMTWYITFIVLATCCYAEEKKGGKHPDFVGAIMDIVGRIEGVTKMTVDMANTIKSLGDYSDQKWGFDFFKIQLKTAAIYKKVIEHSRRNTEISKIKAAAEDFQKTSVTKVERGMVEKLKKLIDASIKTKILAEKLYEIMEPYKYVTSYPEDYNEQLSQVHRKLGMTVRNVYYVLDTTFEFLNYVDKKTWCYYLRKLSPKRDIC